MKGFVDEEMRALLNVQIGATAGGAKSVVVAWIDTAFNGGLVLPRNEIERLGLQEASSTSAILADGQQVELATFTGYLAWFGNEYRTQIIANEGSYPLLGTSLLEDRVLEIRYPQQSVQLS